MLEETQLNSDHKTDADRLARALTPACLPAVASSSSVFRHSHSLSNRSRVKVILSWAAAVVIRGTGLGWGS